MGETRAELEKPLCRVLAMLDKKDSPRTRRQGAANRRRVQIHPALALRSPGPRRHAPVHRHPEMKTECY